MNEYTNKACVNAVHKRSISDLGTNRDWKWEDWKWYSTQMEIKTKWV